VASPRYGVKWLNKFRLIGLSMANRLSLYL